MNPVTLQANARTTMRLNLVLDACALQEPSKRSSDACPLRREARAAVMPQDRRRHLFSHDRLCRRRRSVDVEKLPAGADAPEAAVTRATLALFAEGCVEARAFSF